MENALMHRGKIMLIALAALAGAGIVMTLPSKAEGPAAVPQKAPAGWKLAWSDEFDGAQVDKTKWAFERGSGATDPITNTFLAGWGNNELEFYTSRPENVYLKDGMLHIRAVKESYKGSGYTSARLSTRKLFAAKYGRFEFRAKLPTGKGIWPAIWMLPEENKYGGWAASGEIDILEARGQEPEKILGTLHYGSRWPANTHTGKDYIFPDKGTIADFHVYTLEWDPGEIRWYVDDKLYQTQNFWWSCSDTDGPKGVNPEVESELNPWPAPFDKPFYIILNVAVGGQFLGNPDHTTTFPAEMIVDYVRAYERPGGDEKLKPRGAGKLPFNK
jgi:beta-glucanase (GH16 family)